MAITAKKISGDYTHNGRVTPNDFQKAKYSVQSYSYPIDLLKEGQSGSDNEYGQNYVVFFINVSEDSKIVKSGNAATINNDNISPRKRAEIIGRNKDNNINAETAAVAATVTGAISDLTVARVASSIGVPIGNIGTIGGAAAGAAVLATSSKLGSFTRPQKRLQTAIALHVPNQLSIRYGLNWNEEDTSFFSYATTGGAELENMVKSFLGLESRRSYGASSLAQDILAANILNASSGLSASTGLINNPQKEQIFNGVRFRTFQMDYQFFPRSPDEAQNVLNIIQQFKYHAHPEFKDKNSFIYIYPSEFDIAYYHGSEENIAIHRHTSCVLESVTVNYTPNGNFSTYKDGMPTQINLSLDFVELARLSKDEIRAGF